MIELICFYFRQTFFWCALFQVNFILMYSDVLCFRRTLFWSAFRRITWTRLSGNRRRWKSRWQTDSCTRSTSTSWWSRSTTSMATTGASSPSCWTAPGRNTFPPGSRTRSSTSGRCISVICCGFSPSRRLGSRRRPWQSGNLQRRRRKWCRILPPLQQPHEEDTRPEPSRTVSSSVGPPLSVSSSVEPPLSVSSSVGPPLSVSSSVEPTVCQFICRATTICQFICFTDFMKEHKICGYWGIKEQYFFWFEKIYFWSWIKNYLYLVLGNNMFGFPEADEVAWSDLK